MTREEFIEELKKINIILTETQLKQLNRYYELLIEWNEKINLTRITEEKDVYLKHFYDSITLFRDYDLQSNVKLCDVGTGAGFPGLVLKIVFPTLSITLVDALNKRINFLNLVISELGLKDIETVHSRIEDYSRVNREKFDIVTCRAVANLNMLLEIATPLVKVNGYFIPLKANIDEEVNESKDMLKNLNCIIEKVDTFYLPFENSLRNIIVIKKNKITNKKYPRNFNLIKNNRK